MHNPVISVPGQTAPDLSPASAGTGFLLCKIAFVEIR